MAFPPRLVPFIFSLTVASAHLSASEPPPPRFTITQAGLHFICTADGQPDRYSWRIPIKDMEGGQNDYKIPEISDSELESYATGASPLVSGGRTALMLREENVSGFHIQHHHANGFSGEARLTNVDAIHWRKGTVQGDGTTPAQGMIKARYYSNFPPLSNPDIAGRYGTAAIPTILGSSNYARYYRLHPGYDWRNWNWTLDRDTPLATNQKRIQAMLYLELHTPPSTDPNLTYDLTFVISGADMSGIRVNQRAIFSNTANAVILKTQKKIFQTSGVTEVGGVANGQKLVSGRYVGPRSSLMEDVGYDNRTPTVAANQHNNFEWVSSFFTVFRDEPLTFSSGLITVKVYATHDWTNSTPIQTIQFKLPEGQAPVPDLVTTGTYFVNYITPTDSIYQHPAVQAPRWWGFHRDGVLARRDDLGGLTYSDWDPTWRSIRGRCYNWPGTAITSPLSALDPRNSTQRVPGARALIYGYDAVQYPDVGETAHAMLLEDPLKRIAYTGPNYDRPVHFGTDTLRTIACRNAMIPKTTVPKTDWVPHPDYNDANVHLAYGIGFDFPEITQDPVDHELEPHVSHTLSVAVKSTEEPTYQWRKKGEAIPGATGATYTIGTPNKLDVGTYDVIVTNSRGHVTSGKAKLTFSDPAIVSHPADQSAKIGSTVTLSVTAEGTDLTYQWRKDGRDIPNATQSTVKLSRVKVSDQGLYDVIITGSYDTVISDAAKLSVYSNLTILQHPIGGKVREGEELILSVNATGPPPLSYRWYWYHFPVSGGSSDRLVVVGGAEAAGEYTVQIQDGESNLVTSRPAKVEVIGRGPIITEQPQSQTIDLGSEATFQVAANGESLSYQWRKNGAPLSKEVQASLTLPSVQEKDEGHYDCVVRNSSGATLSHSAALQVGADLEFTVLPIDITIAPGETATFTAQVEGEDVTYQWFYNGKPLAGAVYSTLNLPEVTNAQSGRYHVVAKKGRMEGTASASLQVIESGVLVYKMTGTGAMQQQATSQRVTLSGHLLVDRHTETPEAVFILTRKEGRLNFFEVQTLDLGFAATSAGAQTVFSEMADALPDVRSCLWLQGASSLNSLSKMSTVFAPKTLTGSLQRIGSQGSDQIIESITLKAVLDMTNTSVSCQNSESLDQTIQRMSSDLRSKGYIEVSVSE